MKAYLALVQEVLENGEEKSDRTGVGTISMFGVQKKYDLRDGFPLVTTKKVTFRNVAAELLWFLSGSTNIHEPIERLGGNSLHELTKIWDDWADENGDLGPIYGKQWVAWERFRKNAAGQYEKSEINQVQQAIDLIKNSPDSRRIIVSAWNPGDWDLLDAAPPACHSFYQMYVSGDRLDMQLYQRSADLALGVPYNIASYATLLAMIAQECGLTPGVFTHTIGDAHIYSNHVEGLRTQLERTPKPLPQLRIAHKPFWELSLQDFTLEGYEHDKFIKFPIAV